LPDPIVQDALPAASSAASLPDTDPLDSLSESELAEWRVDGKTPAERETPTADSSPATAVQDLPASTDAPSGAASEAAPRPDPRATENRIPELLADRARERERADRAERHIRDLETRQRQPQPDARPAASSPAPAGLVKPDPETFAYGTADPGYLEALTDYKVAVTLATERQMWEQGQRDLRARETQQRIDEAFLRQAEAAKAKHPDWNDAARRAINAIPEGSLIDRFFLEVQPDEHGVGGAEVLYHLMQPAHAAELERLMRLPDVPQFTALQRLNDRLRSSPAVLSTTAPPPPPTLSSRATPGDPVSRALAMGDSDEATGAFIRAENARDLLRLKR
jgi:hypothetical protein